MSFATSKAGYSVMEALQPPSGFTFDFGVIATYSVDLVAVAASMLAAASDSDEGLEAGTFSFAEALETTRDRLFILCQRGRVIMPQCSTKVDVLFDRYLHEVPFDERWHSWHPKVVLMRFIGDGHTGGGQASTTDIHWRFWLGSRNLTQSTDWEAGVLFTGHSGTYDDRPIKGVGDLANGLFRNLTIPVKEGGKNSARLTQKQARQFTRELDSMQWKFPEGVSDACVVWQGGDSGGVLLDAMSKYPVGDDLTALSPFVDGGGINGAAKLVKHGAPRRLVASREQLQSAVAKQQGIQDLFSLGCFSPVPDEERRDVRDFASPTASGEGEEDTSILTDRGFHAKLLLIRTGRENALWIGSANLTERGLGGRNVEVMARLIVSQDLASGFVDTVREITDFQFVPDETKQLDEGKKLGMRLDQERREIAASVAFKLAYADSGVVLGASQPLPSGPEVSNFESRLLSAPAEAAYVAWKEGNTEILLHDYLPPTRARTSLVVFRLSAQLPSGETVTREWLQNVATSGVDWEERDEQVKVAYLGPDRFLVWVRAVLAGDYTEGETTWDGRERNASSSQRQRRLLVPDELRLEHILRSWARDPEEFGRKRSLIDRRLAALRQLLAATDSKEERGEGDFDPEELRKAISQFEKIWSSIGEVIGA